jgi:Cys-rich protein (TIGR01571 family)
MKHQQQHDEAQFIRVVAPATLEQGYTFDVMLQDEAFTVTVPEGGVVKGEEFEIPYPTLSTEETVTGQAWTDDADDDDHENINKEQASTDKEEEDNSNNNETTTKLVAGRWRHSLCSCCDVFTQATFWLGLCCTPVLLAQLITRLKLSWRGHSNKSKEETSLSFNKILLSFIAVLILGYTPVIGQFIIAGYLILIIVGVGKNVRSTMRRKYNIQPSTCCESLDDCLCMCLCGGCSAIQMARHTHNDKEYPGFCCTTTGLGLDAPELV